MDLTELKSALTVMEASHLEAAMLTPIRSIAEDCDIELTLDEMAQALLDAKIKKRSLLEYEANEKRRRENSNKLLQPFTPNQLIEYSKMFFFKRFNEAFVIDDENRRLIEQLSLYFTNSKEFEVGDYSLNKGILIMGKVGTGKSYVMSFFQKNKKQCYTLKPCNSISDDYLIYKEETDIVYSSPIEKPLADPSVFFQKSIGYCFDDLGTENLKNAYGNKKDVMMDVLLAIYNKYQKIGFTQFHITTNLNKEDLEARYGSRVYSRLKQMFNVFYLTGKDRRR